MVKSYVIALTIIDGSSLDKDLVCQSSKVFVGLRDEEYHDSHVNVLSVPTKRIPKVVFDEICNEYELKTIDSSPKSQQVQLNKFKYRGDNILTHTIDGMLSQKMMLGNQISKGEISYDAIPSVIVEGIPEKFSNNDHSDYLKMINVLLIVNEGYEHFVGNENGVYKKKTWLKVNEFIKVVNSGEYIDIDGSKHTYMCGGLCVCSASKVLANV